MTIGIVHSARNFVENSMTSRRAIGKDIMEKRQSKFKYHVTIFVQLQQSQNFPATLTLSATAVQATPLKARN